jgi:symplekin
VCGLCLLQAKDLALTVGSAAPSFLAVVAEPPEGSELLVLKMLHVLTEEAAPPPPLVDAIMLFYDETGDARFLPPALGGLPRVPSPPFCL